MSDKQVLTPDEKKQRKAEYDRERRLNNLDAAKAASADYYQKNKAAIAEKAAARYAANPDANKEARKKWREQNKEREAESLKAWREKNIEKSRESVRKWRSANVEKARAATSAWSRQNREKINEKARALRAKKVAVYRGYVHKRRSLVKVGNVSPDLDKVLLRKQRGKCACCRDKLIKYHMDHIQPLSKGGPHEDSNIQLLCPTCNQTKSNKDPIEFMQSRGMLL